MCKYHFAALEQFATDSKDIMSKYTFLVIKGEYGQVVQYTPLHNLCFPYDGLPISETKKFNHGLRDMHFLANALTYIFYESNFGVSKISEVTWCMIDKTIRHYVSTTKADGTYRSQQSINRYIWAICNFFSNASLHIPNCAVKAEQLMEKVVIKSKNTDMFTHPKTVFTPTIKAESMASSDLKLMRDIPDAALDLLLKVAADFDPMLYFAIILGICAGLRIGETCNVRQEDSPVSLKPGIKFIRIGSRVTEAHIDLSHVYKLREDGVATGEIKRKYKPTVEVPTIFLQTFVDAYEKHMDLLKKVKCHEKSKPMFVDSRGHAMTAKTLSNRLKNLVDKHFIPALLESGDSELESYGQLLLTMTLGYHAMRHYFTVALVVQNPSMDVSTLAYYRGDKNKNSALTYLRNKGILKQRLSASHANAISYISRLEKSS